MADYYTHFAALLHLQTAEQVEISRELYLALAADLEREEQAGIGFELETSLPETEVHLVAEGDGDTEHVIAFVRRCARTFGLEGRWGFAYAETCSRPRLDGFGGGAIVLDLARPEPVEWVHTGEWLAERTGQPGQPATDPAQPFDLSLAELRDLHAALALAIVACSKPSEEPLTLAPFLERLNRLQERILAGQALFAAVMQDAATKGGRASTSP